MTPNRRQFLQQPKRRNYLEQISPNFNKPFPNSNSNNNYNNNNFKTPRHLRGGNRDAPGLPGDDDSGQDFNEFGNPEDYLPMTYNDGYDSDNRNDPRPQNRPSSSSSYPDPPNVSRERESFQRNHNPAGPREPTFPSLDPHGGPADNPTREPTFDLPPQAIHPPSHFAPDEPESGFGGSTGFGPPQGFQPEAFEPEYQPRGVKRRAPSGYSSRNKLQEHGMKVYLPPKQQQQQQNEPQWQQPHSPKRQQQQQQQQQKPKQSSRAKQQRQSYQQVVKNCCKDEMSCTIFVNIFLSESFLSRVNLN